MRFNDETIRIEKFLGFIIFGALVINGTNKTIQANLKTDVEGSNIEKSLVIIFSLDIF
jgi:hypothetical protein